MSPRILVVDDERNIRRVLQALLEADGYDVQVAADGDEARAFLRRAKPPFDAVLTDLRMPGCDGLALLRWTRETHPDTPVVMVTAHGTVDVAVESMRDGAFDFITKPFEEAELRDILAKAVAQRRAASTHAYRLDDSIPPEAGVAAVPDRAAMILSRIIGVSPPMQELFALLRKVSPSPTTILLRGESGTGKELVAAAIHKLSERAEKPFVAVNCTAIPENLFESELFGHEKGAFTGAVTRRPGRFELADGGTVFLDEIGELPGPMQVKLLRVLQERVVERVGGVKQIPVDVRLVAATNADLAKAVAERRFRDDLFYRLRVVPIEIPPLRARREDLEPLVHHLLDRIGQRRGRSLRLSPPAMRAMLSYDWPGNVRELENALEYATAVCEGQTIHDTDLPIEVRGLGRAVDPTPHDVTTVERSSIHADGNGPAAPDHRALGRAFDGLEPNEAAEAEMIRSVLEETHYQRQATADRLGMSRWTLWRKMKAYRLR